MNNYYTVIKIIDSKTLLIDYGRNQGAKIGVKVRIIAVGPEIKDLKGNVLGTFDDIKVELTVLNVFDSFSVCKYTAENKQTEMYNCLESTSKASNIFYDLQVDSNEITELVFPVDKTIWRGDIVEIIV